MLIEKLTDASRSASGKTQNDIGDAGPTATREAGGKIGEDVGVPGRHAVLDHAGSGGVGRQLQHPDRSTKESRHPILELAVGERSGTGDVKGTADMLVSNESGRRARRYVTVIHARDRRRTIVLGNTPEAATRGAT